MSKALTDLSRMQTRSLRTTRTTFPTCGRSLSLGARCLGRHLIIPPTQGFSDVPFYYPPHGFLFKGPCKSLFQGSQDIPWPCMQRIVCLCAHKSSTWPRLLTRGFKRYSYPSVLYNGCSVPRQCMFDNTTYLETNT